MFNCLKPVCVNKTMFQLTGYNNFEKNHCYYQVARIDCFKFHQG